MRSAGTTSFATGRRIVAAAGGNLRARHLRLSGLPRHVVVVASAAILCAGAAGTALVLDAFDALPGGTDRFGDRESSTAIVIVTTVALAAASAALAVATLAPAWRLRRLSRITIALPAAAVSAASIRVTHDYLLGPEGQYTVAHPLAWAAFVASLLLPLAPQRLARASVASAVLAASPYAFVLAAYATAGDRYVTDFQVFDPRAVIGTQVLAGAGLAALLVLWQAVVGVRAAVYEGGRALAVRLAGTKTLLAVIVLAKLALIGIGYGVLAGAGEKYRPWTHSRDDGRLSWLLAGVFAVAAIGVLVLLGRLRVEERRVLRAAWAAAVGLTAALVVTSALYLASIVPFGLDVLPGVASALIDAGDAVLDKLLWTQVAAMLAAIPVGALLLALRRWAAGAFLTVLGIWALPRAVGILVEANPERAVAGSVDLLTFDAAFTVAVALALATGRLDGHSRAVLTLALIACTAIAYVGPLLGLIPDRWDLETFAVLLVVPPLYAVLLDARDTNAAGAERPLRVLTLAGLLAAALAFAAAQIESGLLGPDSVGPAELVRVLIAVPFALVLIPAALARDLHSR